MYGEKINIYSGADSIQQEFIDAGLNYIRSISNLVFSLPLYKLYPTKTYRDFEKVIRSMQRAGTTTNAVMVCVITILRKTNPSTSI